MNAMMTRFARENGMPDIEVRALVRLADRACRENTRACNGDPYPKNPDPADKNRNAELWGVRLAATTAKIAAAVAKYGFRVDYTGLRPCLRNAAGRYVEIPHGGK
jgi:hypothetical protein